MNPLALKLIGVGFIAVTVFGSGFTVGGWKCKAQQTAILKAQYEYLKDRAQERGEQMKVDQDARTRRIKRIADLERLTWSLTGELKDAQLASPECDRLFTGDGTRLFNDIFNLSTPDPQR